MIRPVDDAVGQQFGANPTRNNPDPAFGNYQPDGHSGQDYKCWAGTPVRAVTSGTVLHIGWMSGTYDQNPWWIAPNFAGYCAVIDHGSFIGIYGHCQDGSARVSKGQRVTEGQVFILSGNTGGSTGDHLHFEILPDGYILQSAFYGRINPESLFTGSLSYAGTVTPIQEDDMGHVDTISDEAAKAIAIHVHGLQVKREGTEGTNTLGWSLGAESQRTDGIISRTAQAAVAGVLFTKFPRQGPGQAGDTDLASVISWFDHGVQNAGSATAVGAGPGVDPEQIAAAISTAVTDALKGLSITLTTEGK